MRAFLLALMFFCGFAEAQTCPTTVTVPPAPFAQADAPAPFGDIKDLHFAWSGGGILIWRYSAAGRLFFNAIPLSSFSSIELGSALLDWGTALSAGTLDAFNTAYAAHATLDMNAPELQAIWCPMWQTMLAGRPQPPTPPATPPAAAVYVVANNFAALNRPTYRGNASTLTVDTSKALAARAPVGATCTGPAFKAGTASTVYMAYQGGPDSTTVAVCTKQ